MIIDRIIGVFAGRGLLIGLAAGAVVMVLAWDNRRMNKAEEGGRLKERAGVEQRGAINAAKADAARRDAERLPADRLRDKYCRDC